MTTPEQIPFDFDFRPALGGEDFLVAPCNAEAVGWLDRWPDWPSPVLVVYGPSACGKTHLAQVFLARTGGRLVTPTELTAIDPPGLLREASACVFEDVDSSLDPAFEESLFHLYNHAAESGRRLMFTAARPASRWPVTLPDLRSRLNAAASVGIGPPDDALIAAVLVKQFHDRQLWVDDDVVGYLLPRMERSFAAVQRLVAAIDRTALAEGRRITVPLARKVLGHLSSS